MILVGVFQQNLHPDIKPYMDHAEQLLKETVEQQVRKEKWTIPNKSWQLRKS